MASTLITRLKESLKCAICLETVSNPKSLSCEHSYCKHCLDKLLNFAPNGSATINCPQGCAKVTRITCKGTTSDLTLNYMLQSTLDVLETTIAGEGSPEDNSNDAAVKRNCAKCPRDACYYCSFSSFFLCETCPDIHSDTRGRTSELLRVEYRTALKDFVIMCEQHASEALYVCVGASGRCGRFLCVYCLNRDRCHDTYKSLEEEKTNLEARLQQVNDISEEKREDEVAEVREALERELLVRKLTRVSLYFEYLDKEEQGILDEFDRLSRQYGGKFKSVAYLKDCQTKDGTNILMERQKIVNRLSIIGVEGAVPSATASISKSGGSFDHDPLGSISFSSSTSDSNNNSTASATEQQKRLKNGIKRKHLSPNRLSTLKRFKDVIDRETNFDISVRGALASSSPPSVGDATRSRKIDEKYSPTAGVIFLEVRKVSGMQLDCSVSSDLVAISKLNWMLSIQKIKDVNAEVRVGVYLHYLGREAGALPLNVNAVFQLSSLKKHLKRAMKYTFTEEQGDKGRGYDFLSWDAFIDPNNGYVINDVARFEASVVVVRDAKPPRVARDVTIATQEQREVIQARDDGHVQHQATVSRTLTTQQQEQQQEQQQQQ